MVLCVCLWWNPNFIELYCFHYGYFYSMLLHPAPTFIQFRVSNSTTPFVPCSLVFISKFGELWLLPVWSKYLDFWTFLSFVYYLMSFSGFMVREILFLLVNCSSLCLCLFFFTYSWEFLFFHLTIWVYYLRNRAFHHVTLVLAWDMLN